MRHLPGGFFSSGYRLDADLYLPDSESLAPPYPAIIGCSGYQGLKTIHPERFARGLVPAGNACLAFDHRGFGASEGERGRLVPQEQVEDVISAVSFLQSMPEIDVSTVPTRALACGTRAPTAMSEVAVQAPSCPVRAQRPSRGKVTVSRDPRRRATWPRWASLPAGEPRHAIPADGGVGHHEHGAEVF
jgi:X-Pro dipeptidyl-peptidase (S15 family)